MCFLADTTQGVSANASIVVLSHKLRVEQSCIIIDACVPTVSTLSIRSGFGCHVLLNSDRLLHSLETIMISVIGQI